MYSILAWLKQQAPVLRRASFEVRSTLARTPALRPLFKGYIWWDQQNITARGIAEAHERTVTSETALIIDGFPGSANSFATAAFRFSQSKPVRLAHHLHAPVQVMEAIEKGIPTLVTLRDPHGAVLSLTSRWPHITVSQGLRHYARFYETLWPYRDGFVMSTFAQTTERFDEVMQRVNERFGTDFDLLVVTPENLTEIRQPKKFQTEAWQARQARKAEKKRALMDPALRPLIARAEAIHAQMAALAAAEASSPKAAL